MRLFKDWVLRLVEPWREEQAALDLEWEKHVQQYHTAGLRPWLWKPGDRLDPEAKLDMPDEREVDPDYLHQTLAKQEDDFQRVRRGEVVRDTVEDKLNAAKDRLG